MSSPRLEAGHRQTKKYKVILVGLAVHALLLFAVFDIYFASPLEHGMSPVRSIANPPAKRLVLFVADGLRAEAVLGEHTDRIPFLKSIVDGEGSWGVAHTRVPTESRPGHVALLAGIYEDPSAIMKGWKANPVHFDSVINQSAAAWCWGSPDILNIFNKDELPHIHLDTYSAESEDFGANETGLLDLWVFDRVQRFLYEEVGRLKEKDGVVFFLHLLGIDTAGHGYKPHSPEYIRNIQLVDENVGRISKLFDSLFEDDQTAFVFTADHGMTDWGSHGAGSAHETETPLVIWGAGIKRDSQRLDVKQIDLAPLLSSLIGINIPSNSIGVIPDQFLNVSDEDLALIHLSNTLQLFELFKIKHLRTEQGAYILFLPYKGLTMDILTLTLAFFNTLRDNGQFNRLISECKDLMDTLINGLDYYHNYHQGQLLIAISVGFITWILFLVTSVLDNGETRPEPRSRVRAYAIITYIIPIEFCYVRKFPFAYYVYLLFPLVVYHNLLDSVKLTKIYRQFKSYVATNGTVSVFVYVIGVELLVYGFFNRCAFSLLSILIGLWVLPSDSFGRYANRRDKILWLTLCLLLSVFPLFPVMKTTFNLPVYLLGCVSWTLLFYEMYCRLKLQHQFQNITVRYWIFYVQFFCLLLAAAYSVSIEMGLVGNNSPVKYLSWCLLVLPISLIPFASTYVAVRLIATFFGFAPFYLLVSSNFEALFSSILVAILCNWLLIESKSFQANDSSNLLYYVNFDSYQSKYKVNSDMFRRAFLFMVFIFIGFFGTGNIASLNSFDPMWVRAFLTVFSPFKMMGLILMKIMVPFLFTCCVFRAINSIGKEDVLQMFCIILIFSDLMVLQFLYLITNVGSWLDIGSSLSHFVIMEGFVTILLVLYGLAHWLTTASYIRIK